MLLGISKSTILRAVRQGEIMPARRTPGGFLRFWVADVATYNRQLSAPSARHVANQLAPGQSAVRDQAAREGAEELAS